MISIREDGKGLSRVRVGRVGEPEVHGTFEVLEKVLDSLLMRGTRIGVEAGNGGDSVGYVRLGCNGQTHEGTNCIDVGDSGHLLLLLGRLRAICSRKNKARLHGSRDRVAVEHAEGGKGIDDVLVLGKGEGTKGTIPGDLYAKEVRSGTKISKFEIRGKLLFELLNAFLGFAGNGNVIHKNWNNKAKSRVLSDIDGVIRANSGEAQLKENRMQLFIPKSTCLL